MTDTRKVTLHWMRNALSCTNILAIFELAGFKGLIKNPSILFRSGKTDIRSMYDTDSKLSEYGVNESCMIKNHDITLNKLFKSDPKLIKTETQSTNIKSPTTDARIIFGKVKSIIPEKNIPKYVLTSALKRSIETAIYTFGHLDNLIIIPVPYIGEPKDKISPLGDLKEYFGKFKTIICKKPSLAAKRYHIEWSYLEHFYKVNGKAITEVNSKKFDNEVLPYILKEHPEILEMVVISHSGFISTRATCKKPIKNLEILDEQIEYVLVNDKFTIKKRHWLCDDVKNPMPQNPDLKMDIITKDIEPENPRCEFGEPIKKILEAKSYLQRNKTKATGFLRMFVVA